MNEIAKFISVQHLWQLYERCEKQLARESCLSLTSSTSLNCRIIGKMQMIVIAALNEIEEMLLDEIRRTGWYEDEDSDEQKGESKEALVEEDK